VSRLAKNVSRLGFVTVKTLKNHQNCVTFGQKRGTIHHFKKKNWPKIVSRFGQCVTNWQCRQDINFNLEKNLGVKIRVTISVP